MTTSRTSFLYEIEKGEPIPLGKLAYLRERTRNILYDFVVTKFIEAEKNGLSQAELSRRIRKRPEVVNRLLGSPGNWRIDTISDLLVGISAEELDPHSVSLLNRPLRNQTFPVWFLEDRERTKQQNDSSPRYILEGQSEFPNDNLAHPLDPMPASSLLS